MSRLTKESDVFFAVELLPVYAHFDRYPHARHERVHGRLAAVNMDTGRALGVVSDSYKLITNREAMDAALKCASIVFPETRSSEWKISGVDAPSTGSSCHIDLVHTTATLDFDFVYVGERPEVPDAFGPFIRVSNSYNGRRALTFTIGFFRKQCRNGLVGPQNIIRFSFDHTKDAVGRGIKFVVDHRELQSMKREFLECFQVLRDCPVDRIQMAPLIHSALGVREPKGLRSEQRDTRETGDARDWHALVNHIFALGKKYADELGDNAYAVLNAVTDMASNPPKNRCLRKDRHSMQRVAGEWLIEFREQCQAPSFSIERYIAERVNRGREAESRRGIRTRQPGNAHRAR